MPLRTDGMRRSSSRQPGAGRASTVRRPVGSKWPSSSAAGSIVVGITADITLLRQMQEISNTELLERPLSARSVIASLLLGLHPPQMRAARLVQWCELFGIAPGTARVALSRMTERGELVAVDGTYELAGRVRARQSTQEWSLAARAPARRWPGDWRFGVVV